MAKSSTTGDLGTSRVKRGLAEMLKGGVIMDVVTAEQARIANFFRNGRITGDHRAAFGRSDVFDAIEAEAQHVPGGADPNAVVRAAKGVRGVFDDAQIFSPGERASFIQRAATARVMHGHDGFGARSDSPRGVFGIETTAIAEDIARDRRCPRRGNGLKRRDECQRGN